MAVLLAIAVVGFFCAKQGVLDAYVKDKLTLLLLNVTLPCMVVASTGNTDAAQASDQVLWAMLAGGVQFFALLGTGWLCNLVLRTPPSQRHMYLFMSVVTNTGFIGIPVVAAIYGNQTVLLSSVFVTSVSLFVYSIGFSLLSPKDAGGLKSILKAVANPATVASLIAIGLLAAGVHLPAPLEQALEMLGGITAPVAMLLVGVIVAGSRFRDVVSQRRLYPYILIRQLIVPAALFVALRPIVPDPVVLGMFTVMFAMPVGSMASMFAGACGHDQELPAKGTILSTVASFAIVPALVLFMQTV